jgi:putative Mg2+ transporter-C (MgtC) family protein
MEGEVVESDEPGLVVTGVGMACGAGLPLLAVAATVAYFIVALVFPFLLRVLPGEHIPTEQSQNSVHD